ncbi:MAG: hypothetical protein CL940_05790 [Deltaproteobacteria bacterium]|nr:hypothetical protein [Deltaproteobacteria bacterium]
MIVAIAQWDGPNCVADAPYTLHVAINGVDVDLSAVPASQGKLAELPQFQTIPYVLKDLGGHTKLLSALEATAIDLKTGGPYTLFAPTDAAFTTLQASMGWTPNDLLTSPGLDSLLLYHVVEGIHDSGTLGDEQEFSTLSGQTMTVVADHDEIIVNGEAYVVTSDIESTNGVIHVLDTVLSP